MAVAAALASLLVDDDAEVHYLPEPLISAAHGAGRANEPYAQLRTRLTVRLAGSPLSDQELTVGPGVPSWSGPAVRPPGRLPRLDRSCSSKRSGGLDHSVPHEPPGVGLFPGVAPPMLILC